jgi:hypothetical protein
MNKTIVGILVCMLFVGSALPTISSTEKSTVNTAINPVTGIEAINSMSYEECNCYNQTGTYSLGYLPLPDSVKPTLVEAPTVFLTELDWRSYTYNGVSGNWLTSVKNQGQCGSCWAFGAIGCLEAMINIAYINPNVDMDLSEQYMVSCVTSCSGCNGGNAYYCYKYMKDDTYPNDGALPESCFPYTSGSGSVPPCSSKCSDWINKLVKKITNYGISSGSSQIKSRLSKGPVCLSFQVYDDFYDYTGGIYQHVYGSFVGWHQVVCVGYSDSGGYWICKNSWGSGWGESGWFKIKFGECSIESEMIYCDFLVNNLPPNIPSNPNPGNHATGIDSNADLSWSCSDPNGDPLTYDVYFGTSSNPPLVKSGHTTTTYDPGTMSYPTLYYWMIVAKDNRGGSTTGPVWDFTTTGGGNQNPNIPSNPNPGNHATDVDKNADLSWTGGDPDVGDTVTYDVYFGTSSNPPLVKSGHTTTTYDPGTMSVSTHYYWKIVAKDNRGGSTTGPVWDFTTTGGVNQNPDTPSNPSPANHATGVNVKADLSWTCSDPDGDPLTYDVYFGTSSSPPLVKSGQTTPTYNPRTMSDLTNYYWMIVAKDNRGGSTTGPVWVFKTKSHSDNDPPNTPSNPNPGNHANGIDKNADLSWTCSDPDGDPLTYDVYFGTSSSPPLVKSGHTTTSYDPGTMSDSIQYYWMIVAKDNHGASTTGIIWDFTTPNDPPDKPSLPSGEKSGKSGQEYSYFSNTSDSNDDQVYYLWDWGDGNNSGWLGPYDSGVTLGANHIWETGNNYVIKVKAKDEHGAEGSWSDPLPITMPYSFNKPILQFLELLFQQFPHAFPILRQLLGY